MIHESFAFTANFLKRKLDVLLQGRITRGSGWSPTEITETSGGAKRTLAVTSLKARPAQFSFLHDLPSARGTLPGNPFKRSPGLGWIFNEVVNAACPARRRAALNSSNRSARLQLPRASVRPSVRPLSKKHFLVFEQVNCDPLSHFVVGAPRFAAA